MSSLSSRTTNVKVARRSLEIIQSYGPARELQDIKTHNITESGLFIADTFTHTLIYICIQNCLNVWGKCTHVYIDYIFIYVYVSFWYLCGLKPKWTCVYSYLQMATNMCFLIWLRAFILGILETLWLACILQLSAPTDKSPDVLFVFLSMYKDRANRSKFLHTFPTAESGHECLLPSGIHTHTLL